MKKRPASLRKRPRIGDIIEIPMSSGFAYMQYVLKHDEPPHYGPLMRVFPGIFDSRPEDFTELSQQPERFLAFYPLAAAANQGLVKIVGASEIPERLRHFPLFKAAGAIDEERGRVKDWWLWDGKKEWNIGKKLTKAQKRLSICECITHGLLVERIETGWSPEDEVD